MPSYRPDRAPARSSKDCGSHHHGTRDHHHAAENDGGESDQASLREVLTADRIPVPAAPYVAQCAAHVFARTQISAPLAGPVFHHRNSFTFTVITQQLE
jgi:hypothetical protein